MMHLEHNAMFYTFNRLTLGKYSSHPSLARHCIKLPFSCCFEPIPLTTINLSYQLSTCDITLMRKDTELSLPSWLRHFRSWVVESWNEARLCGLTLCLYHYYVIVLLTAYTSLLQLRGLLTWRPLQPNTYLYSCVIWCVVVVCYKNQTG